MAAYVKWAYANYEVKFEYVKIVVLMKFYMEVGLGQYNGCSVVSLVKLARSFLNSHITSLTFVTFFVLQLKRTHSAILTVTITLTTKHLAITINVIF